MTHPNREELAGRPTSLAEIEAGRSPAGGFTKETLAAWGIGWPPPKGWKESLIAGDDFAPYVPEPVTAEEEAWSRALCEAADDEPERLVGCPALPLWRSYLTYARLSLKAAAALRQSPSVEEVARMIDDAPDEWSADELAQAIVDRFQGRGS